MLHLLPAKSAYKLYIIIYALCVPSKARLTFIQMLVSESEIESSATQYNCSSLRIKYNCILS